MKRKLTQQDKKVIKDIILGVDRNPAGYLLMNAFNDIFASYPISFETRDDGTNYLIYYYDDQQGVFDENDLPRFYAKFIAAIIDRSELIKTLIEEQYISLVNYRDDVPFKSYRKSFIDPNWQAAAWSGYDSAIFDTFKNSFCGVVISERLRGFVKMGFRTYEEQQIRISKIQMWVGIGAAILTAIALLLSIGQIFISKRDFAARTNEHQPNFSVRITHDPNVKFNEWVEINNQGERVATNPKISLQSTYEIIYQNSNKHPVYNKDFEIPISYFWIGAPTSNFQNKIETLYTQDWNECFSPLYWACLDYCNQHEGEFYEINEHHYITIQYQDIYDKQHEVFYRDETLISKEEYNQYKEKWCGLYSRTAEHITMDSIVALTQQN